MIWAPNVPTEEEIEGFVEDLMAVTPEILGIDETVPGCEVINMDPYGVGVGTLPRYIKVAIREYYQDVFYRGGLTGLSVGDYVTVTHLREGNRYEVTGAGGSSGTVPSPPPNPVAQGQALVSNAVPEWVASLTPTWAGEHSFVAGIEFTGASDANEITVPDNTAIALELLDAGGLEHLRIVSTNANPYFLIDPAGAGIKTGIGTAAPNELLHIKSTTGHAKMEVESTTDNATIFLNAPADEFAYVSFETLGVEDWELVRPANQTYLEIKSSAINLVMVFEKATGNVGIGVIPNQPLTVEGTIDLKEQAAANPDTVAYGQIWVKNATPNELWFTDDTGVDVQLGLGAGGLPAVAGAGYALVSDGVNSWVADQTPAWTGEHSFGAGIAFTGATGVNAITIPDNLANALHVIDSGDADVYLQIVTTTGSEEVIFNAGGDDVDFTVQAVGVADALQVRGSDGQITLGVLTAGYAKSSAGGVLSVVIEVALADLAGYVQGRIIRGGAADWEALAHPGAAGYVLISDATDIMWDQTPTWTGEHSFGAGIAFTGASGANEITVPDNTAIALELLDAGGLEYMRVVSTDANPYLLIDPAATGFLVGVGIAAPAAHLDVYDATVNTTATYHGGRFDHTKTAGVTDTADNLCGLMGNMRFNQVGGVVGHVGGLSGQAAIAVGEIGQSGTLRHLRGLICTTTHTGGTTWGDMMGAYMFVDANAGTIGRDVFGCNITVDIEAAMTSIGQNVYGLRVWMDVDQDPVGTVYGIYLTEGSNQDYGFYQSGSADNYFGGNVGIGTAVPGASLDVTCTTAVTNTFQDVVHIEAVSTGNMADGFGPRVNFAIKDGAVATQHIASIIARRDGADNTGGLLFAVKDAGAWDYTAMYINPSGAVAVKALVTSAGAGLTIDAAGAITVTHSYHDVDTFGGAATDNLDTINGGVNGQILILRSTNSARDPTLTQAGNIWLDAAGNFTLTSAADRIILNYQGGSWYEISRSDNN